MFLLENLKSSFILLEIKSNNDFGLLYTRSTFLSIQVILCDEERVFCKRKTKTMRRNCHPEFHQTLLFEACNALGATLTIEMRLKDGIGSGKSLRRSSATSSSSNAKYSIASQQNQSTLGFAHIALDRLSLTTLTISWYRLIPVSLANIMGPSKLEDSS